MEEKSILYIKYMVSQRCKMLVERELQGLSIAYSSVDLGIITLLGSIEEDQIRQLRENLQSAGLELLEDRRAILISKIKNIIIEVIHYTNEPLRVNYSEYISKKLQLDYTYLANIFSEVSGTTIQQFIITQKIEKVKELILYNELSLTEISYQMHYSSVAHLSNQFKKITGLSPSYFKKLKEKRMNNLENL